MPGNETSRLFTGSVPVSWDSAAAAGTVAVDGTWLKDGAVAMPVAAAATVEEGSGLRPEAIG